jgi:putative lipoic acid-binding regulatory protein
MSDNGIERRPKIEFPLSYNLKVIMSNGISQDEHIGNIKYVLLKLKISFKEFSHKLSSNEKYISFTVMIRIENEQMFKALYLELQKLPEIKYAM